MCSSATQTGSTATANTANQTTIKGSTMNGTNHTTTTTTTAAATTANTTNTKGSEMMNKKLMGTVIELSRLNVNIEVEKMVQMGIQYFAPAKGKEVRAKKGNTLAMLRVLEIRNSIPKLVEMVVKLSAKSLVVKQLTLGSVSSQVAEWFRASIEDPKLRFRVAEMLIFIMKKAKVIRIIEGTTRDGKNLNLVKLAYNLSREELAEIAYKTSKSGRVEAPKDWSLTSKGGYSNTPMFAGHRLKVQANQPENIWKALNYLQSMEYKIDTDVSTKFSKLFMSTLPTGEEQLAVQNHMKAVEDAKLHFAYTTGLDNGRVYCEGYLTGRQIGMRNLMLDFAEGYYLSQEGRKVAEERIEALQGSKEPKELLELYKLEKALEAADRGEKIHFIIHFDAKASGLQMQSLALRSKSLGTYVGLLQHLEDIYRALGAILGLSRDEVKNMYNPYQYGAGEKVVMKALHDKNPKAICTWEAWEAAYAEVVPEAYALRCELVKWAKHFSKESVLKFTSPSGYNCVLTAVDSVGKSLTAAENNGKKLDCTIETVLGRHDYVRSEVRPEFMGVKLVAAFSHMLDASALNKLVLKAKAAGYQLDVIHDSFGTTLNDAPQMCQDMVEVYQEMLVTPILKNFVKDLEASAQHTKPLYGGLRIDHLMANDLTPTDVVGALYQ